MNSYNIGLEDRKIIEEMYNAGREAVRNRGAHRQMSSDDLPGNQARRSAGTERALPPLHIGQKSQKSA